MFVLEDIFAGDGGGGGEEPTKICNSLTPPPHEPFIIL